MKKVFYALMLLTVLGVISCKDEERFVEPNYVLTKWAGAIRSLNYREYAACEAYPKNDATFREMYRSYYLVNIMTTEVDPVDEQKVRTDPAGNRYLHRALDFEASIINRQTRKPTGILRGNAVFVRFLDGRRTGDGWLISNRTLIPVNR